MFTVGCIEEHTKMNAALENTYYLQSRAMDEDGFSQYYQDTNVSPVPSHYYDTVWHMVNTHHI